MEISDTSMRTNAELADELSLSVKDAEQHGFHNIVLKNVDANRIIAALRQPSSDQEQARCAELEKEVAELGKKLDIAYNELWSLRVAIDSALKAR